MTPLQGMIIRFALAALFCALAGCASTTVYRDVVPFADLTSGNKEQLDGFCRAIEELLPALQRLRGLHTTGANWAAELRRLLDNWLDVPENRPAEKTVRDRLLGSLTRLQILDDLGGNKSRDLSLAVVREFVQEYLEGLPGTKGEYLTGGVTISAFQPLRPIPFRLVYVLGLGEGLFPGVLIDCPPTGTAGIIAESWWID